MSTEIESRYRRLLESLVDLISQQIIGTSFFSALSSLTATPIEQACSAPINRLPVEVLERIFYLSLENYARDWGTRGPPSFRRYPKVSLSPGCSSDPVILAQVCMLWRAIALSTPLLWSKMSIHCSRKKQTIPLLKLWLERSGTQPLDITFFESLDGYVTKGNAYDYACNPMTNEVITLLMEQSNRWKSVDFQFARNLATAFLAMPEGTVPQLESAKIASRDIISLPCPPMDGLPQLEKVWRTMFSSPAFRSGGLEVDFLESTVLDTPWSRLTTVEVIMTAESLFAALPQCRNLTTLRFTCPYSRFHRSHLTVPFSRKPPPLPETPITVPLLRDLSITTEVSADNIFASLTLPSLTTLYVEQQRAWNSEPDPSVFAEFLNRSGCSLQKYSYNITGAPISENVLVEILSASAMSTLSSLVVEPPVTEKLSNLLTRRSANRLLLPRLERLSLARCKNPPGTLSEMVKSRREERDGLALLRDVHVRRWEEHGIDVMGFRALAMGEQEIVLDFPPVESEFMKTFLKNTY